MLASRQGHTATVQALIGAGADLDLQGNDVSGDLSTYCLFGMQMSLPVGVMCGVSFELYVRLSASNMRVSVFHWHRHVVWVCMRSRGFIVKAALDKRMK
jgi:hypothetical protein